MKTQFNLAAFALLFTLNLQPSSLLAQGTAFTYQGRLDAGGALANGSFDLRFAIYDAASGGNLLAGPLTNAAVAVSNGLFTVALDFGAGVFTGPARWLEIGVRTNGGGAFTALSPRQELRPTPYALYSPTAGGVTNGSVTAGQLRTTNAPAAGQVLAYNGSSLVWTNLPGGGAAGWSLTGNSGTTPGVNFLGTTDSQPLELKVNNARALRLERPTSVTGSSVNVIGGFIMNRAFNGAIGATIAGGGLGSNIGNSPNEVGADFGSIGGGWGNRVTGAWGTVPGGVDNQANGLASFAAGNGARANHDGAFVWNSYGRAATSFSANRFHVFAQNGFSVDYDVQRQDGGGSHWAGFGIFGGQTLSTWTGAYLDDNGDWYSRYVIAYGEGNEQAYIGGDGIGNDVQIGSMNPTVTEVYMWNAASGCHMNLHVATLIINGGCDLAEPFEISTERVAPGSVLVIDEAHPGRLKLSTQPYDKRVAGVVSGANGVHPGISLHQAGVNEGGENVALSGRVYVLADADQAPIEPGDLLTTSATPGYAMKATDPARTQGAVLGKAMSGLKAGKGTVLMLVTLQ
jgi:hypothetical protein